MKRLPHCLVVISSGIKKTMRLALGLLVIISASAPLVAQTRNAHQPRPLVFTHVTVIDANRATAKPDMTVIITGDRITAVGRNVGESAYRQMQNY